MIRLEINYPRAHHLVLIAEVLVAVLSSEEYLQSHPSEGARLSSEPIPWGTELGKHSGRSQP